MQSHNDSFYSYFPVLLVRLSRLRQKNFWKENLITDQKHRWKWQKNFSFQFRMSDSGGKDFWVTHFSRIQASLSKMFNLENDRRKVIQRRRAAKKSWELSLGSLIVCSTGCATTKTCVNVSMRWRAVEFLTFCVDFVLLCREARFAVEKQGRHPIPVLSLIGVKRSCQSPHPTASRTTIPYSEPPHKRHQKQNTRRNFSRCRIWKYS